jgi:hypothetical protein
MLRIFTVLLILCSAARSEESGPTESEHKAEIAQANHNHRLAPQQITVPANNSTPAVINIFSGKHAEEEGSCTQAKDWKEWGSFAWCRSLQWIDTERMIAIWTVILGIATCILGIATWRLAKSTDKLVRGADATAERQLRAYLTCFAGMLINIEPSGEFRAGFIFQNDGLTPAHDVEQNSIVRLTEWPLPDNFAFPPLNEVIRSKNNLSPRSTMTAFAEPFDHSLCQGRPVTQADIIQIMQAPAHGRRLVIFGEVRYRDAFNSPRFTRFCAGFGGNTDLLPLAQQGNWQLISQITRQPSYPWGWELSSQHNIAT